MVANNSGPKDTPEKVREELIKLLARPFKNKDIMDGIMQDKLALKHRAEKLGLIWSLVLERAKADLKELKRTEAA